MLSATGREQMPKKLTLVRVASHDFNRALRVWKKVLPPAEIFNRLIAERSKALIQALRNLGLAVVGTLWLTANKTDLALKISFMDVSVPTAYVNFAVSCLLFGTLLGFLNYMLLNEFVRIAVNKLFKFDTAWAFALPSDGGNAWTIAMVAQFRFLQSSQVHKRIGILTVVLVNIPVLIIIGVIYWTVLSVGAAVLRRDGLMSISGLFTIVGWMLALMPIMLAGLFRAAFSFSKNVSHVRWGFLVPLYRRSGAWPPRVGEWTTAPPST